MPTPRMPLRAFTSRDRTAESGCKRSWLTKPRRLARSGLGSLPGYTCAAPPSCSGMCVQPVQVGADGDIAGDGGQTVPDQRLRLVKLALPAAHDEHVRAFDDEPLRRRQADTAAAAGDHGYLAIESWHQ